MATSTNQNLSQRTSESMINEGNRSNLDFGISYLEREFDVEPSRISSQVAPNATDYGIDGFHFDPQRRNLYLFSFNRSDTCKHLNHALQRVAGVGIDLLFADHHAQRINDQLIIQIRSCLAENEALIDRVCIHFVFTGDPRKAERSQSLDQMREDLESKKHVIDKYFGRPTTMVIDFRSAKVRMAGAISQLRVSHSYPIQLTETISSNGPSGEKMLIGFVPLADLHAIYKSMGSRFFDRNIRSALPETEIVNCSLRQALREILIDRTQDPATFAFNHNGVTLYAEAMAQNNEKVTITEPRVLNGAQTIINFERFLKESDLKGHPEGNHRLRQVFVLSRVITDASRGFVTTVTINNNRQNPVRAWNLHANDMIQLELQDRFRDELGIYYERQQNSFEYIKNDSVEQEELTQFKPIDLLKLARTFLVSDGQLDYLGRFHQVFEHDEIYNQVFNRSRLEVDPRRVILCHKVQFRLKLLVRELVAAGDGKYDFASRGRSLLWALLCQAILNDANIESLCQDFGRFLGVEAGYQKWLLDMTTTKCRVVFADLARVEEYSFKILDKDSDFIRSSACYAGAMSIAHKRWRWSPKQLC
jgi:AIPR protein